MHRYLIVIEPTDTGFSAFGYHMVRNNTFIELPYLSRDNSCWYSASYRRRKLRLSYSAWTRRRLASPMRRPNARSEAKRSSCSAKAAASSDGKNSAFSSSFSQQRLPAMADATMGRPQAIASNTLFWVPAPNRRGETTMEAF